MRFNLIKRIIAFLLMLILSIIPSVSVLASEIAAEPETETVSGNTTPTVSGNTTPTVSGNTTPTVSGNTTPTPTGTNRGYIRAKLTYEYDEGVTGLSDDIVDFVEGWTKKGDWYYYDKPLVPGDKVRFISCVHVPETWGNEMVGKCFKVIVTAEASEVAPKDTGWDENTDILYSKTFDLWSIGYEHDESVIIQEGKLTIDINEYQLDSNGNEVIYENDKIIVPGQAISKIVEFVMGGTLGGNIGPELEPPKLPDKPQEPEKPKPPKPPKQPKPPIKLELPKLKPKLKAPVKTAEFQENIVTYLYDEASKKIEVTSGLYMDQANGGLSKPWFYYDHSKYFRQYGWNTEYDGSGSVMPIDLNKTNIENVLVSIGEYMRGNNPTHTVYSDMTWWAEWRGEASFVAGYNNNDGHIDTSSGCQTSTSQVTVTYSKNGRIWYNDKGHIDNAAQISYFDHWNRASSSSNPTENAAGNDLELGVTRFRGGEVFYAIYYIADFKYTGQYAVFTAPTDGSYTFQLWGSPGGNCYSNNASDGTGIGGNGGYTEVTMNLSRNQSIYTFVGSAGAASRGDACAGGFNGGGPSLVCMAGPHSASGGGATHISNVNNPIISDLFVKLIGTPDPNEEDDSEDDGSNDEGEGDGSTDPTTDTYSYETVTLYYGKSLKGATQAELIAFVRNKLMTNDNWYKSYINNSTNITEVGLYRSYSNGKRKGGTNNAKTAWFLIECHTWNSINETIAIAGGGSGGSSIKNLNGMVYGWGGGDTADRGYGGNNANNKRATFNSNMKMADNSAGIGYAQGTGMYNSNSSGGGGGWWGGYSSSCYGQIKYQKKGGRCGDICGGGTSYVNTDNNKVTITDSFTIAGNDSRLSPGGSYEKPRMYDIGINGYVKVTKNSGW